MTDTSKHQRFADRVFLLPSNLVEFYPQAGINEIASKVEQVVLQIIDEAK